jgi:type VI secretion system secreted protein Hcp
MATVDYFLKIDGIEGESQDLKHKSEIQLMSWTWGASAAVSSGQVTGKYKLDDIVCWMKVNKASVGLMSAISSNRRLGNATITCRKAGKDQQDFYKIKLTDVLVSSFTTEAGKSSDDPIPVDRFALNYGTIEFEYREQKPDGTLGGAIMLQINLRSR